MTSILYQAKVGDGFAKKGFTRKNSFFKTPKEAFSEALALKERIDKKYKNKIEWDYNGMMKGSAKKVKILRGFLNGNRKSEPFYLQILTLDNEKENKDVVFPKKPQKLSAKDKQLLKTVANLFNK